MITLYCACGEKIQTEEQHLGRKVKCPRPGCGRILEVRLEADASRVEADVESANPEPSRQRIREWPTTFLCMGCGAPLGLRTGTPPRSSGHPLDQGDLFVLDVDLIYEGDKDEEGEFLRCPECQGKNYYLYDESREAFAFRKFKQRSDRTAGKRLAFRGLPGLLAVFVVMLLAYLVVEKLHLTDFHILVALFVSVVIGTLVSMYLGTRRK